MATIKISDLHSPGSELFSDSESYMNELGDSEFEMINGGTGWLIRASKAAVNASKYLYSVAARNTHRLSNYDPGRSMPGSFLG